MHSIAAASVASRSSGLPDRQHQRNGPAVVEQAGAEDVLDVGREDEAVQLVVAVLADLRNAGVKDRLHEVVAVVEEVGALVVQPADQLEVVAQRLVDQLLEALGCLVQHLGALLKGQSLRAVAAVVRDVAGGLVGEQVDVDVFLDQVLQQVDDVAVVSDRARLAGLLRRLRPLQRLIEAVGVLVDPALGVAGHDAGDVDLGDDRGRARDVGRLALCAGHAAKAGGDIELAGEVALLRDAQHQASGVEKGVEGAVDDALRADVHPAAGGHLAVVGDAQSGGAVEGFLIVEHADHQAVGDDDARRGLVGFEQAQRVAGFNDEGLVVGEHLEVFVIRRYCIQFWQTWPVSP